MKNVWTDESYDDPISGKRIFIDMCNGVVAKRIQLNSKLAKHALGLRLIETDLRHTLNWLNIVSNKLLINPKSDSPRVKNIEDKEIVIGLYRAAVTTYAKCFNQGKERLISLQIADVENELRPIHNRIISIRNTFTAHSDTQELEKGVVSLLLPCTTVCKLEPKIKIDSFQIPLDCQNQKQSIGDFLGLARKVHATCLEKMNAKLYELYEAEVNPINIARWYSKSQAVS